MGILRSVALGKSRKSAGELTFYQRIGVACFRQKPAKSPGYKSTVPQRMQQSVFRFMKANVDAANLKSFIDIFYDAKPRKGKSETKMNMFYRAFMPHLVAQKANIYELPAEDQVNPAIYLGTPATNNDKLTNGQLGDLVILTGSATSFTMSAVALDQIIDKANTMVSDKSTPFTIDDLFIGLVGADSTSPTGYKTVSPTSITPTLADGIYTFDITAMMQGVDIDTTVYVAMLVAGKDSSGDIDITRRKFATDSAKLQGNVAPTTPMSIVSAAKVTDNTFSVSIPTKAFADKGIVIDSTEDFQLRKTDGTTNIGTAGSAAVVGLNQVFTFTMAGSGTLQGVSIDNVIGSQVWSSPEVGDYAKLTDVVNSVTLDVV